LQKDPGFVLAQQIEHDHDDEGEHDSLTRIFHKNASGGPKPPLWPLPERLFGLTPITG
jgi:hypothetical protein